MTKRSTFRISSMQEAREILKQHGQPAAVRHLIDHGMPMGRANFVVQDWINIQRAQTRMNKLVAAEVAALNSLEMDNEIMAASGGMEQVPHFLKEQAA